MDPCCNPPYSRRRMLREAAVGFGSLAFAALLADDLKAGATKADISSPSENAPTARATTAIGERCTSFFHHGAIAVADAVCGSAAMIRSARYGGVTTRRRRSLSSSMRRQNSSERACSPRSPVGSGPSPSSQRWT